MTLWRHVGLWALWMAGLIGLGGHDERVSAAQVDMSDPLAGFIASYGELPGLGITALALHVALSERRGRLVQAALAVALAGTVGYMLVRATQVQSIPSDLLVLLVAVLALFIAVGHYVIRPSPPAFATRSSFAPVQLTLSAIVFPLVMLLKTLWGRPRFRELEAGVVDFAHWYEPLGITGFQSFPSGHVAVAWFMLGSVLLVPANRPRLRTAAMVAVVAWGLLVAWARIRIGAHWLTDVWLSTGICWLTWGWCLSRYDPQRGEHHR